LADPLGQTRAVHLADMKVDVRVAQMAVMLASWRAAQWVWWARRKARAEFGEKSALLFGSRNTQPIPLVVLKPRSNHLLIDLGRQFSELGFVCL